MIAPEVGVSIVLIAYNQQRFVKQACLSVLSQDFLPLDIIFSDDCSSDGTYALMEEVVKNYQGHHHVRLRRNEQNLGLVEHINKVVSLCSGEIIVYAAGDDISMSDRVKRTVDLFAKSQGKALIVHSGVVEIDGVGHELGYIAPPLTKKRLKGNDLLTKYSIIIGATCAWHRSLWDVFGPLCYPALYEDLVMASRAQMMGGAEAFVFSSKPLVFYRVGAGISQGGRNKPKNPVERQVFELKRLKMHDDVANQRLDDAKKLGLTKEIEVIKKTQLKNKTTRLVYEKQESWWSIAQFSIRHRTLATMLQAAIKRFRVL